ncbi:Ldh family oxidoreductase [Cognatishimia sp. F0-27]|uniref:Ldh family oxidoreductase n=1 Tax=Cognatishimia sp. F0-27 TaxID=2816855 RepID=UPI001D0C42A1|nr:Ldh family oxidoreductase [Cognatishimia sp. F0-27]MCC1494445.1 Ldh family oxidoreductase [Cognatishimia sp. F0-27]
MPTLPIAEIEQLSEQALVAHGARADVAAEMARAIAWAEARGNRICGLYYLESYCQQLVSGRVKGHATPVIDRPRPAEMIVDAQHGFAQSALRAALPDAVAAVRETGTLSLAIHHAHTCTALGYFTESFAREGVLALGLTNASPIVAAPGGKIRQIGTNPIAFAVPDGQGGVSMMFDQSTTTVALGRITMAKAAGETIPEGWAIDADGAPTTDPEAALGGSLTSAGGYKGWGFGLMAEILAACLGGGVLSREVKPLKAPEGAPHDLGQFFVLIHPDNAAFYDRMAQLAAYIAEDAGVRMPGQGKTPADHAEVPEALRDQLVRLAQG